MLVGLQSWWRSQRKQRLNGNYAIMVANWGNTDIFDAIRAWFLSEALSGRDYVCKIPQS